LRGAPEFSGGAGGSQTVFRKLQPRVAGREKLFPYPHSRSGSGGSPKPPSIEGVNKNLGQKTGCGKLDPK
jgi:hypothetical protein